MGKLIKGISTNITKLGVLAIFIAIAPNLLFSCTVKKAEKTVIMTDKPSIVHDEELAVNNVISAEVNDKKQVYDTLVEHIWINQEPELEPDPERVFLHVEQMPKFTGGDAALIKHINQNMQYPENAFKNNAQGVVTVKFVVTKSGTIGGGRDCTWS